MATQKKPTTTASQVASVIAIPGYRIKDVLGKGGCAVVYLAVQESIGREVALKVLAPDHTDDDFTDRFLREARIVSQLNHPNIITIFDAGVHQNVHYMAMEYVSGKTFSQARNDLSRKQRIQVIKEVAIALDYAGKKGFVHRDIKPENVLMHEDGRAILTDFGIARSNDVTRGLTQTGKVLGTPYFMSPEQTKGLKVDHRSDIYGMGVMLFQALTGFVPFDGPSLVAIGIKHLSEPTPALPKGLEIFQPIVNKAMSKDPQHRYQTAHELYDALSAISDHELDYVDAKIKAYRGLGTQANTTGNSETVIETRNDKGHDNRIDNRVSIPDDMPRTRSNKTTGNNQYNAQISKATQILESQDFQSLTRRRRRLLVFLLLILLTGAGYYHKDFLLTYWQTTAYPYAQSIIDSESAQENTVPVQTVRSPKPAPGQDYTDTNSATPAQVTDTDSETDGQPTATSSTPSGNNSTDDPIAQLQQGLAARPANASELAEHYRTQLATDPQNEQAKTKLLELRNWFAEEFKSAIDSDNVDRAQQLLRVLESSFPNFIATPRYSELQKRIEQAQRIQTHLGKARVYFAANALVKPDGANALEQLHKILAIRDDHPEALRHMEKIYQQYLDKAKQQKAAAQYFAALESISYGLRATRDKTELLALQNDIKHIISTNNKTKSLLKYAQEQLDKDNLLTPDQTSAYAYYSRVLKLDPANLTAQRGIKTVEQRYVNKANTAIRRNDFVKADKLLKTAELYFQTSPDVIKSRRALDFELKDIVPSIPVIRISNTRITSLQTPQTTINKITPGKKFYIGFSYKNFTSKQHEMQIKIFNGTGTQMLAQNPATVAGPAGEHYMEMNLPIPGAADGNYILEIHMNETRLIKANLFGLH